ncbi:hypothetical protein PC123_g3441 [Phytophthora cactorum]|nr:hypothetical protein PC120_g2874 [Phytophthora cactorum]KAG4061685.1 hypothetical protein PC123_g3441 [Phytophthora cactorum]
MRELTCLLQAYCVESPEPSERKAAIEPFKAPGASGLQSFECACRNVRGDSSEDRG